MSDWRGVEEVPLWEVKEVVEHAAAQAVHVAAAQNVDTGLTILNEESPVDGLVLVTFNEDLTHALIGFLKQWQQRMTAERKRRALH